MRDGLLLPYRDGTSPAVGRRPRRFDRWLAAHLQAVLAPAGVAVQLWDGSPAAPFEGSVGSLAVLDRVTLVGLIVNPDLYFGEAYTAGRVALAGNLAAVVAAFSRLSKPGRPSLRERLALWLSPANDLLNARRNAAHHYNVGNAFYELWLGQGLVYTCACYADPETTLEEAQVAKLDLVCRKLKLQAGERVVEAGCGWGALALHMARHYGVKVRAFNVSSEQIAFARGRAAREGLADRVEFVEDDYRNISGHFDAFVSIGMLEHVGRRRLGALADVLRRSVEPHNGRALLHFIGRDHPRPLNPWIRRRIFPGAYPPSLGEVVTQVMEPSEFSVLDVENLRLHYARTLADWRARFDHAEPAVTARFGESFCRAWRLYLAGSEAAFATGWMQLFQILCAPAGGTVVHWLRPSHGAIRQSTGA
jgi:cyclopropane-fatty-acyl-phospholipid synthase